MQVTRWQEHLKKRPWLHFALPLLLAIVFDYLQILLLCGQVLLVALLVVQVVALICGLLLGATKQILPESPWAAVTSLKVVRVFPGLALGERVILWAMSADSEPKEDRHDGARGA